MRKSAFCIFLWPLCSDIIFLIDHYCAGVSNKHCLLPFFISPKMFLVKIPKITKSHISGIFKKSVLDFKDTPVRL